MSFSAQSALTTNSVGFNSKVNTGYNYKVYDGDMFHYPFVFTNFGGTPWVDSLVSFSFDHREILQSSNTTTNYHPFAAPSLSDLRVYDSDALTPLKFTFRTAGSHCVKVYVRLNLAVGASKTVYMGLGRRGDDSMADDTIFHPAVSREKSVWLIADGFDPATTARYADGTGIYRIKNHANEFFSPVVSRQHGVSPMTVHTTGSLPDNFSHHIKNNNARLSIPEAHKYRGIAPTEEISIFMVARSATVQGYTSVYRNQASDFVVYPFWDAGNSQSKFIISTDGGITTGLNTGVRANQYDICSAHWKKNTTNGMRTYRGDNLAAPIAQRNSANVNLPVVDDLHFFHFNNTEHSNVEFYELIVFKNANLDAADREGIYEYLRATYNINNPLTVQYTALPRIQKYSTSGHTLKYVVDNSFKSAKTNHIQVISLDTAALVTAGELIASCESTRVYDVGGNPLDFYMINKNTADTKIVIKIPSLSAGAKYRIVIKYNNIAIGSVENEFAVVPPKIASNSILWLQAHKQATTSTLQDSSSFNNDLNQLSHAGTAIPVPLVQSANLNNLQAFDFQENPNMYYRPAIGTTLAGANEGEMTAIVAGYAKTSARFPMRSMFVFRDNASPTSDMIFPDNFGRLITIENGTQVALVWPGVDPGYNIPYALSASFSTINNLMSSYRLETTGYAKSQTRSTIQAGVQMTTSTTKEFWFGTRNFLGELPNAEIAEIILLNCTVTDAEMKEIMNYINSLYHIYDIGVLDYTLEEDTFESATTGNVYEDYSHIATYESNSSINALYGGIVTSDSDIKVLNVIEDNFIGTQNWNNWSRSTLSQEQNTYQEYERTLSVTDTSNPDIVQIGRYNEKSKNKADFVVNKQVNLTTPELIRYNDNDYVSFRLYVEDATKLNLATSKVIFKNLNIAPYSPYEWWINSNYDITVGQPDPFGGNNAVKVKLKPGGSVIQDFLTFASMFGEHPAPLDSYGGIHTGHLWLKRNAGSQTYVICQYGSAYGDFTMSSIYDSNEWEELTVTTNVVRVWESFGIRTRFGAMGATDEILIFAPNLTPGTQPSKFNGFANYEALLSASDVPITNGYTEVKIKRSAFTGSGSWDETATMSLDFVCNSGQTTTVSYSDFKFIKNYNDEAKYKPGATVSLGRSASVDEAETWVYENEYEGTIVSRYIDDSEQTQIKASSLLSVVDNLTFADLPTFGTNSIVLDYSHLYSMNNAFAFSFTAGAQTIKFILSLIFPVLVIRPNTTYFGNEFQRSGQRTEYPQFRYMSIRSDENVGQKIREILRGMGGILRYNPINKNIEIITGNNLYNRTATQPKLIDSIIEFNSVKDSDIELYNSYNFNGYISVINNQYTRTNNPGYLMGTGGKAIEVKPTGTSSVEIFIPLSDLDISKSDFPVSIRNFHISNWNFSTKENDGATLNNSGMSFIGGRIVANDVLVLRVRNTNSASRFLYSISFDGDHHGYTNDMLHNHAFTVGTTLFNLTLANQFYPSESKTAVKQLGKRDYNSDLRYIHYGFTFPAGGVGPWYGVSAAWLGYRDDEPGSTFVYQMINELSLVQKQVSFTCVRLTNILIGDKVKFKDQSSREVEALVVGINNIDEDRQKVLVRVLKQ